MSGGHDEFDDDRPPMRHLSVEECWERLEQAPYGRLATTAAGEIDVFPVNHRVDDDRSIVFRTSAGSKLVEILVHSHVAFEVDGYTDDEAWSVLVRGTAAEFADDATVDGAATLGVDPWIPDAEERDRWVRIIPAEVHGRWFARRADG